MLKPAYSSSSVISGSYRQWSTWDPSSLRGRRGRRKPVSQSSCDCNSGAQAIIVAAKGIGVDCERAVVPRGRAGKRIARGRNGHLVRLEGQVDRRSFDQVVTPDLGGHERAAHRVDCIAIVDPGGRRARRRIVAASGDGEVQQHDRHDGEEPKSSSAGHPNAGWRWWSTPLRSKRRRR